MLSELEIEIGSDINNSQSNSDKNVVSLTLTTSIKKKVDEGTAECSHYTSIGSGDVLFMMWSCALEYSDIIHSQILDTLTIKSLCLLIIV